MNEVTCGNCRKVITNRTEVEYSVDYGEFYCDHKCAINDFFERARCLPVEYDDEEKLRNANVEIVDGKFYWV